MENRDVKRIILYFVLYRLMDLEEILWNVADFIIKPVALLRGATMRYIGRGLSEEEKERARLTLKQ